MIADLKLDLGLLGLPYPTFTVIDRQPLYGDGHYHWTHTVTVWEAGQSDPQPIVDGRAPISLPDGYTGRFAQYLISDKSVVMPVLATEG